MNMKSPGDSSLVSRLGQVLAVIAGLIVFAPTAAFAESSMAASEESDGEWQDGDEENEDEVENTECGEDVTHSRC